MFEDCEGIYNDVEDGIDEWFMDRFDCWIEFLFWDWYVFWLVYGVCIKVFFEVVIDGMWLVGGEVL